MPRGGSSFPLGRDEHLALFGPPLQAFEHIGRGRQSDGPRHQQARFRRTAAQGVKRFLIVLRGEERAGHQSHFLGQHGKAVERIRLGAQSQQQDERAQQQAAQIQQLAQQLQESQQREAQLREQVAKVEPSTETGSLQKNAAARPVRRQGQSQG